MDPGEFSLYGDSLVGMPSTGVCKYWSAEEAPANAVYGGTTGAAQAGDRERMARAAWTGPVQTPLTSTPALLCNSSYG